MDKMTRIAIIGTRGIPNHYGGFEQCAEYLAVGLVNSGYDVIVYNSHNHPYQKNEWNGVKLVHCFDPEEKMGTVGQFIYDFNCILDIRKRDCDIIIQLGYTSSSVWGWMLPKNVVVTTNMDGLEWKRTKYSNKVKRFLLFAESLGIKYSDHLISDSIGIQDYIKEKYNKASTFIAYGAKLISNPPIDFVNKYDLVPYGYDMLIARLEPENSIEIILDGVVDSSETGRCFLVVGKVGTTYGEFLQNKYKSFKQIRFLGGIYDINTLNALRFYSNLYFHGHTVGGTNPSLLEAMASSSLISANDNPFNKYILGEDALYFKNKEDVTEHLLDTIYSDSSNLKKVKNNRNKITDIYDWPLIVKQYAEHIESIKGVFSR